MRSPLKALTLLLAVTALACSSGQTKKDPSPTERARLLTDIASAALGEGDSTGALAYLDQAQQLDPKSPGIHYLFALAYYQKKELDLAIASARKTVTLAPRFTDAKNTLGKLLVEKGEYDEAEPLLREAASDLKNPNAYMARTNLGMLYFKSGKKDLAKAEFTRVIGENAQNGCVSAYFRGQIFFEQGLFEKAQKDFHLAGRGYCGNLRDAHILEARTLMELGRKDLARAKLIEIQKLFPNSTEADTAAKLLRQIQ
jgi:type IV pilus assembly protein PilF